MRKARFLLAVDHVQLDRLRYLVMRALDSLFTQCDVLIGPFMTGPMLIASNYTGHPCLHLRAGFEDLGTRSPASLASGKLTTGEADQAGKTFTVPQGISPGVGFMTRTDLTRRAGERPCRRRPSARVSHLTQEACPQSMVFSQQRAGMAAQHGEFGNETQRLSSQHNRRSGKRLLPRRAAQCPWAQETPVSGGTDLGPFGNHPEPGHAPDRHGVLGPGLAKNIHSSIVTVDKDLNVIPGLCESFEVAPRWPDLHLQTAAQCEVPQRRRDDLGRREILL